MRLWRPKISESSEDIAAWNLELRPGTASDLQNELQHHPMLAKCKAKLWFFIVFHRFSSVFIDFHRFSFQNWTFRMASEALRVSGRALGAAGGG